MPAARAGATRAPLDAALKRKLAAVTELGPGILAEDKGYSLALHYRLAPEKGAAVRAAVDRICAECRLGTVEILPGKLVVEIKAVGVSKANAVCELMNLRRRSPTAIRSSSATTRPTNRYSASSRNSAAWAFPSAGSSPDVNGHFEKPESVRAWLARDMQRAGEQSTAG